MGSERYVIPTLPQESRLALLANVVTQKSQGQEVLLVQGKEQQERV